MADSDGSCQVAIIGAGPYGLSTAAHLRGRGIETRIFGEPMEFWNRQMPRGMFLRSAPSASSLDGPGPLALGDYRALHHLPNTRPVPIEEFVRYGQWFQEQAVPDVERRRVTQLAKENGGFRVRLHDGEEFQARRVVVATGISPFAYRPAEFAGLPSDLVSHSLDHYDLSPFAGKRVVVIGSGQSALESAALLHEAGAEVEVVARAPGIVWLLSGPTKGSFAAVRRLLGPIVRPPLDIMGPRFAVWLVAWPRLFRKSPKAVQDFFTSRAVRPAGASWLRTRLAPVRMTLGRTVAQVSSTDSRVQLRLSDGSERMIDHVFLGTGYRVDVARYPFLDASLRDAVRTRDGYPVLGVGFESSVPGMHFLGTPAANTFGPICRFVSGTTYASRAVTQHIVRRSGNGHVRSVVSTARSFSLTPRAE